MLLAQAGDGIVPPMTGQDRSAALPHDRFDSTPVPAARRLEAWREAIGVLYDIEPVAPDAAEAPVVLDSWHLGPAVLASGTGPAMRYERSARAIGRDGRDLYMLQVYRAGHRRILRGGPDVISAPGDLVVNDALHPKITEHQAFDNVNLLLPRSALAPLLREPDAQGCRVVAADRPLVALARGHLAELVAQAPRMAATDAAAVLGATVQIVAAAINGEPDDATVGGVRAGMACVLRRHIDQHLDDPGLTPETLAGAFGLSRATVYRLFAADGGVRRYVQERRLARARRALVDPAQHHRTVAEIGQAAGYRNAQDFIRAYRRAFDRSPGEEREAARLAARRQIGLPRPPASPWVDWIRRLR